MDVGAGEKSVRKNAKKTAKIPKFVGDLGISVLTFGKKAGSMLTYN